MHTIDTIKSRIKISEEIGKYIVLKKKSNSYWGLCPFHNEKTPSFSVNDEKNFFYCFGCGVGGDFFSFIQRYKNLSFKDSVEMIASQMSIPIKHFIGESPENKILTLLSKAKDFYKENIIQAKEYLIKRNISMESMEKFDLGFAKENTSLKFLVSKGFSMEDITNAGICTINKDRFRNRLIFPIKDRKGSTIAFGGRTINDQEPKYLNSSETVVFKKSFHLFGENFLEYGHAVIVVEGYLDVIALSQIGIKNVVATMGTSLSKENSYSLFKVSQKIFLMFDGDESGIRAIERNLENILFTLQPEREIWVCSLKNEDPYDAAQKGQQYLLNVLKDAIPISRWIKVTLLDTSFKSPEKHAITLNKLSKIISSIKHPHVRSAFEIFFKDLKPKTIISRPKFSKEEEKLAIIFILWKMWDQIVEELVSFSFHDATFEEIRVFIVESLCKGSSCDEINQHLLLKWQTLKSSLLKKTNLIYVDNEKVLLEYFLSIVFK